MQPPGRSIPGRPSQVTVELPITLGQFVKVAGLVDTGGSGKLLITSGLVQVNGQVETRRGHKLAAGDIVQAGGQRAVVVAGSKGGSSSIGG
jgi:ribosome-associated protein